MKKMFRNEKILRKVVVHSNDQISNTSWVLRIARDFDFTAGQVIGITTSEKIPTRMYSIASGEKEEFIDILYTKVETGKVTPKLSGLKTGETILVTDVFGNFISSDDSSWFISSGTGIAPFLSMLKSGNSRNKYLLHGSRHITNFYESVYLEKLLKDRYIRCYTGNELSAFFKGRVSKYLEISNLLSARDKYYLCGSSEMVVDTREILISRGIPYKNIYSEIYF